MTYIFLSNHKQQFISLKLNQSDLQMAHKQTDLHLQKILNKFLHPNLSHTTDRYLQKQYSAYDSRITNCQLQEKNLELQKQFKRLQKILNKKLKVKSIIESRDVQIEQIKQKLMSVLNESRILEESIYRVRGREKERDRQTVEQIGCCCSRRRSNKKKAQIKSVNKKQRKYEKSQPQFLTLIKLPATHRQIQCNLNYLQQINKQCEQKRNYVKKLEKILEQQNKVIQKYQKSMASQPNVGKITKVAQLKHRSAMRTCASIGSIIKIKEDK